MQTSVDADANRNALRELRLFCPWPNEPPLTQIQPREPGWLGDGVREILTQELTPEVTLVVELGSWLGLSTRFIADHAPGAVVVAIDHWRGSPEHHSWTSTKPMLPTLYETFLSLCWDYRDRLIPLRMSTLEGLKVAAKAGIKPDLVYIDAEHSYHAVAGEIELVRYLFPWATIVGADYDCPGVAAAVHEAGQRHRLGVDVRPVNATGRAWKLVGSVDSEPRAQGDKTDAQDRVVLLRETATRRTSPAVAVPASASPCIVDCEQVRASVHNPRFLTYPWPSADTGLHAFGCIARELARRRPDIPILVVDRNGTGEDVLASGLDPDQLANVHVMAGGDDSRRCWASTKIAVFPWLAASLSPAPAVEAMINGIPIVASDRSAIVECIGRSGVILPLPGAVSPHTHGTPSTAEMTRWIDAIIELWDDPVRYLEHRRLALSETARLATGEDGKMRVACPADPVARRRKSVVLVPYLDRIDPQCDRALSQLETLGVRVKRTGGCSAIDVARNQLASEALHEGAHSLLFIDSDLVFDSADALRVLARPELVVSGVYAKKSGGELACAFADGIKSVVFGLSAPSSYLLKYAGGGFLRIQPEALKRMIRDLRLPVCNKQWGRGIWPFFMPLINEAAEGGPHYLGEDWAFSHRLRQIGIHPVADTFIRLYHFGSHGFSWEETGLENYRYRTYTLHL